MTSKSSTIRRLVKRDRTHRIPFSENCLRRNRSLSSCLIHSYSSFSLSFSTRNPVSPSFTISGVPPTEKAMAVFPSPCPPPGQDRTFQSGKEGRSGLRRSAGVPHRSGVRGRELYRISAWRVFSFSAGGARSLFR